MIAGDLRCWYCNTDRGWKQGLGCGLIVSMVEMELEVGSGLEGYKEGELQGRVLNLASGEYGILRINEGKADAIWAGSLDTCAMLVVKGGDVVAALHYRDEKTNGGELSKLVAKVRGKSDETVEVEVVWGRLNRGQESQTNA